MNIKKEAYQRVVDILKSDHDKTRWALSANKRAIQKLADEQAVLKRKLAAIDRICKEIGLWS